jgi:predicted PurR-regulated permease PerM
MATERQVNPLNRAVLLAAALLLFGLVFQELVTLLIAVLITILLAIPMAAFADALERRRVPRPVGALLGLLLGVALFVGVLALIIPPFADQTQEFIDQVPATVDSVEETIADITGSSQGEVGVEVQQFLERYTEDPGELVGPLASIGISLAGILGALVLMLITAFYMAINPAPLLAGCVSLFPPERRQWARAAMNRLRAAWIGWMQGVIIDMALTGVLLYAGLELIGLDFAIFFAVFAAILVLIPYFGAIIGAIPPTLFALADSPEKALLVLGIYLLVQQVESNVTIPLVMANRVKLHPAVVAIGVVVIGQLFGFVGLFVSVPILSLIVIVIDEVWVKPMEAERGLSPEGPPGPASAAPAAPPASEESVPERRPRLRLPGRPS